MFGHTVGGHDTTSSLFSVGKGLPMQKLKESPLFRDHAKVFTKKSNSQEKQTNKQTNKNTWRQGEEVLVLLYGGTAVWMTRLEHAST